MKLISIPAPIPLKGDEQSLLKLIHDHEKPIGKTKIEAQPFSSALTSLLEKTLVQPIEDDGFVITEKGKTEQARFQYHKPFMDRDLKAITGFLHNVTRAKLYLGYTVFPFFFLTNEGFLVTTSKEEVLFFIEELEEEERMYAYSKIDTKYKRFTDDDFEPFTIRTMASTGGSEQLYRVEDRYEVWDDDITFTRLKEGYESKLAMLQERNKRINGQLNYSV